MAPSSSDPPQNDALLLRCYVREGSEAAFRALAGRHLPLIWSTARRIVNGDAALAEDIAQSVLVDFARQAASLPAGMPAAGWLHRHTVFTATKCLRTEARRRARERTAALPEDAMSPDRESWAELAPHLDDALNRLREQDRQAILLRYYEMRTLREVGQALGTSEEAVRKRLDRAVEKLRRLFARRGLVPAAAVLLLMLKNESVAAPAGAAMRRIIGAAWSTLESGPVAPAPPRGWWRSRSLGGSAAAILILSLGVWLWLDHDSSGQEHHERRSLHNSVPTAPVSARQMEEGPPVTLTATVMILPEADVAPHMIDYNPGEDDAALYGQLLPRATALQAQTPHDATLATTGYSLIVLTGAARPSARPFTTGSTPGDPFGPPSATLRQSGTYRYPTEFDPPDDHGRIALSEFTSRNMGTELEANISPAGESGTRQCQCLLNHMFAPPEEMEFFSLPVTGRPPGEPNGVTQPVFRCARITSGPFTLEPDSVCLAGMTSLPADLFPEGDRSPRRLLLFLKFVP